MKYLYGVNWHEQLRKPIKEMTEAAARKRFQTGPQLCVAAGPDLQAGMVPDFMLLIGAEGQAVRTQFFDEHGSVDTMYAFEVPDLDQPDRMFLHQVTLWLYPDEPRVHSFDQSIATTTLRFTPEGEARRRMTATGAPQARVSRYQDVDVSAHWAPRITFGDWQEFGRRREPALPEEEPQT